MIEYLNFNKNKFDCFYIVIFVFEKLGLIGPIKLNLKMVQPNEILLSGPLPLTLPVNGDLTYIHSTVVTLTTLLNVLVHHCSTMNDGNN